MFQQQPTLKAAVAKKLNHKSNNNEEVVKEIAVVGGEIVVGKIVTLNGKSV
jgi:hypothetical protein